MRYACQTCVLNKYLCARAKLKPGGGNARSGALRPGAPAANPATRTDAGNKLPGKPGNERMVGERPINAARVERRIERTARKSAKWWNITQNCRANRARQMERQTRYRRRNE